MARHTPTQNPQSHTHRAPSQTQQAVDATQQAIIDNLQKKVEQAEAKLHEVEQRAAETQAALDKQIAEKKAQLAAMNTASEPASQSVAVAPAPQPAHTSKKGKIDWNPLNRVRHIGTRALSGVVGFPSRVAAKVNHIVARPQQLVSGGFRKDLGKNILKTPGAILTTLSGAVYRPHRDKVKFEDNFKDYGPTFWPDATDKNRAVRNGKKALWAAGKVAAPATGGISLLPKFFANVGRGMNHFLHETAEGIRDSKRHWNPKNWNFRPWKFSKTLESFGKAFSRNKKGKPAGKVVHMQPADEKKAA